MIEYPAELNLSEATLLDLCGIYDLHGVKELIVRDEKLTGIDEACAKQLAALEVLSLSHNRISSLRYFDHLANLVELNLNFNQISSLETLSCTGLEKLFVANNQIGDITHLKTFTKLSTLSLYGNQLTDLHDAIRTLRALPKLRALDLGGNPCVQQQELTSYKFEVLRLLPRLKELDGDQITQLDRELMEEYMRQKHEHGSKVQAQFSLAARPSTAPAASWAIPPRPFDLSNPQQVLGNGDLLRGKVRLFRDDFLNNHPILLEYLAHDANAQKPLEATTIVDDVKTRFQDPHQESFADALVAATNRQNKGFVEKMRSSNPVPHGIETSPVENEEDATQQPPIVALKPHTVHTRHLEVDPSDPKTTIRKLLKHIEVLTENITSLRNRQVEGCNDALIKENKRLQIENNNIPVLQDEISSLKKQLILAQQQPQSTEYRHKVEALERENAQLKRDNERLRALARPQSSQSDKSNNSSPKLAPPLVAMKALEDDASYPEERSEPAKRLSTDVELLEDSSVLDVELTELILQNEISLEIIRNEIKSTKKEWEMEFQRAKEQELARIRPATSLGLHHGRPRLHNSHQPQLDNSSQEARRLHTSAGTNPLSGPSVTLLERHTSKSTFKKEPTKAEILTL